MHVQPLNLTKVNTFPKEWSRNGEIREYKQTPSVQKNQHEMENQQVHKQTPKSSNGS
jgi:hypothetical protein